MSHPATNPRLDLGALCLWASACVLIGLIIVQAGRVAQSARSRDAAVASTAYADVVARVGDYTTLTFNAGSDDVLAVLDGRGEELYFYRVRNQREFEFLGRENLRTLFSTARRIGSGRK